MRQPFVGFHHFLRVVLSHSLEPSADPGPSRWLHQGCRATAGPPLGLSPGCHWAATRAAHGPPPSQPGKLDNLRSINREISDLDLSNFRAGEAGTAKYAVEVGTAKYAGEVATPEKATSSQKRTPPLTTTGDLWKFSQVARLDQSLAATHARRSFYTYINFVVGPLPSSGRVDTGSEHPGY